MELERSDRPRRPVPQKFMALFGGKMATKAKLDSCLLKGAAYERRIKMTDDERKPRFSDNGVPKWAHDLDEDDQASLEALLTPSSWKP